MKTFGIKLILFFILSIVYCSAFPELKDLPEEHELWMGFEEAELRPGSLQKVSANFSGELKILKKDGECLKSGDVFAIKDPKRRENEIKSYELDIKKAKYQIIDLKDKQSEQLRSWRTALEELENQAILLKRAINEPQLPIELRKQASSGYDDIMQEIQRKRDQLNPKEYLERFKQEVEEIELRIKRRKYEFHDQVRNSEMRTTMDGILHLEKNIKHKASLNKDGIVRVENQDVIGEIWQEGYYQLVINASSNSIRSVPSSCLIVTAADPKSGEFLNCQLDKNVNASMLGDEKLYFKAKIPNYQNGTGAKSYQVMAQVYCRFPKKVKVVYKKDIAFVDSSILASAGWGGVIKKIWPDAEILQIGPQAIAITNKKDGN